MGSRQDLLTEILITAGYKTASGKTPMPSSSIIKSPYYEEALDVYQKLGGIKSDFPPKPGRWDMEFEGLVVELDEERHFNRYRLITLESKIYDKIPLFPVHRYRHFCQGHEGECLRSASHGGYWSNSSCEKWFGPPSPEKGLSGNGSPRWKQRAFYDYLKDLSIVSMGNNLVRISVWDKIELNGGQRLTVDEILKRKESRAYPGIIELIKSRIQFNS